MEMSLSPIVFWLKSNNRKLSTLFVFLAFFVMGLLTISDYGISWDEPIHFRRGYAYLNLFLTGSTEYELQGTSSFYKDTNYDFKYWIANDGGHPPLNGVLSAASNHLFYEKLNLLGDIEGFNIAIVFISALLVALVFWWGTETFGIWSGLFSALILATYPLFWAESHFNIKDPIETSFFFFALYFFWKRKTILSALFVGFALSVKFNVLFFPVIVVPWIIAQRRRYSAKQVVKLALIFTIIPVALLFFSWPYLWQDPSNLLNVFRYYKQIGTQGNYQPNFVYGYINYYSVYWIILTTPVVTLLLFAFGIIKTVNTKSLRKQNGVLLLWILAFLIPVARVSLSGFSSYGGVRQIMEFIPGMALIAGYGASMLVEKIKPIILLALIVAISIVPLVKLHPYENVYFNSLVGGLKGATDKNIPAAGNTLGNAYLEGIGWINENAEKGASLSLLQGTTSNLPLFMLRDDINYSNYNWSGVNWNGEYLMELTHLYDIKAYIYGWEWVNEVLVPVYEVKRDGVPLLTIWKNDKENTKEEYRYSEQRYDKFEISLKDDLVVSLLEEEYVSRLMVKVDSEDCLGINNAKVSTSVDGENWKKEGDPFPFEQVGRELAIEDGVYTYYLPFRAAKYVRVTPGSKESCIYGGVEIEVLIGR